MTVKAARNTLLHQLAGIADQHEDFLYGRCATLAIAMHRLTGAPIYGLVGYSEEEGRDVLVHAYVKLASDTRVDIKGPRALDEILADFLHVEDVFLPDVGELRLTERAVAKYATGSSSCPSLSEATPLAKRIWAITQKLL